MSIPSTKAVLQDAHERLRDMRFQLEKVLGAQKDLHELYDPVLRLERNVALWPAKFQLTTFTDLAVELAFYDAAVVLVKQRVGRIEELTRELAQYLKIIDMYARLKQTPPPGRHGGTAEHEVETCVDEIKSAMEDIPALLEEMNYHVTGISTLVS